MEESLPGFGSSLQLMGGGLAVTFIIAIAAGILAMTLVYVGSALLVLDRFARVSKGWRAPVLSAVVVALCFAVLSTVAKIPGDSVFTWEQWRETLASQFGQTLLSSAVFLSAVSLGIRKLSQRSVARIGTFLTAFGVGLGLSAMGNSSVAPITLAVTVALGAALWGYRSLRKTGEASTLEWLFGVAAVGLAPGAALAFLAPTLQTLALEVSVLLIAVLIGSVALGLIPLAIAGFIQMRKSVEWFIAIRYLVARRRQVFISAISAICVSGIAAGVWLIIVVLSVMNGFE